MLELKSRARPLDFVNLFAQFYTHTHTNKALYIIKYLPS